MNETQPDLENWDDFLGSWFKAEFVKTWPAVTVFMGVKGQFDAEDNAHLIYDIEYSGKKLKWEPNKTNIQILKEAGLTSPKALIGKKVYFKKVMNFNPQIKKKVPSFEVERIE